MRVALTCAVGRRWLVAYWSPKVLCNVLTQPMRIILFAAASFAALRTPRELAVLRLVSVGRRTDKIAQVLGLGEETVRSHRKKVQGKLGVRNRTH
jgi:DNA-binding CsgD family transcriptional regulator